MPIKCKEEVIEFRDGSKLTISESNWDIGMKLARLVEEAEKLEVLEDQSAQLFRVGVYPKLIAPVIKGTPLTEEQARAMPESELDLWYEAVKRINPKWFAVAADAEPESPEVTKKKDKGNA